MSERPVVLFLCTHNAGRSLAASVLLDHYALGAIDVHSAGSEPAEELNPSVVALLRERDLDPGREFPKPLSDELAHQADVIVTMGCGDTCPVYAGKRSVDWDLEDPAGRPVDAVRPIVEEIDRRVQVLLSEVLGQAKNDRIQHMSSEATTTLHRLEPFYWPDVRSIYAAGIATGNATFETEPPDWETWDESHLPDLRFVAVAGSTVVGWVAASPVSDRCCYSGVVENSVYVDPSSQGHGIGRLLLSNFIEASEKAGVWTIQTGIFPENVASVALHEACGFRIVGRRERLGQLAGQWRDVLLLERRSSEPAQTS
jgi:L-amino acid N-acyltransferase YncA/protein-tyrosine-phosphatase